MNTPIENVVILIAFANKEVTEKLAEVGVIRFVIEAKRASVVQEYAELVGESSAEEIGGRSHLFLHDAVVLLLLGSCLEALPGKSPTQEIHEDISERFEIIAASLFNTQVSVDRSVTCCTGQIFVLSVRDV